MVQPNQNKSGLVGLATANKGITTEEGKDMASKKFQLDQKKADMNNGIMGYDDVSGNPIPLGSNAENVRDDIDAKLSTDEYVLPAHVVKWHGLKHIQMMQSEAEMGLMSMQMDGLIQHADTEEVEEVEEAEEVTEDVPSEEMDIEASTVEVDDLLDDEEATEEETSKTSNLQGMLKKQKYAFIM